jgi:hypothetical protein
MSVREVVVNTSFPEGLRDAQPTEVTRIFDNPAFGRSVAHVEVQQVRGDQKKKDRNYSNFGVGCASR